MSERHGQVSSDSYFVRLHQNIPGDEGGQRGGEADGLHVQEVALEVLQIPGFVAQVDLQGNGERRWEWSGHRDRNV